MSCELRLALIGMGEVGQILAVDLQRSGAVELSAWDRLFPVATSLPARRAQALEFVRMATSSSDAIENCSVVVCAVTAGECIAAAREAAYSLPPNTYYLDLNSVAPETKREAAKAIEAAGGRYVEAAVMSPIGPKRLESPIWIGGPHAPAFLPIAQSLGFTATSVYSPTLGTASAAKMCRSVLIKGMEALLAEGLLTARRYGVERAVLDSLTDLIPAANWRALGWYMISRSLQHGARRAEEMSEAARTVAAAGVEPWMADACVKRHRWAAEYSDAQFVGSLEEMLDTVLRVQPTIDNESPAALMSGAVPS